MQMQSLWKSLLVSPFLLGAIALSASAQSLSDAEVDSWTPVTHLASNSSSLADLDQVTSVSQLTDVRPTDWAFQALQSLVERYGCIVGYPDRTYRGNRALSRYEFAAGVNACLDKIQELIAAATADFVRKEDLEVIKRLQEEFAAELATLRGRVDALDVRTATLEKQQFSLTTKLNGEVVFAASGLATGQNARGEDVFKTGIFGDRVRLNFDTSFTGEDLLRTRLQAGNFRSFTSSLGTFEGEQRFASPDGSNEVEVDALLYQFPVGEKLTVVIEANAGASDDFVDTVNPFLDGDGGSGALTNFGSRNPIHYLLEGTGLGLRYEFNDFLEISGGYLAADASSPLRGRGLFNGAYGVIGQLTIKPSEAIKIGLTYVHAYNNDFTANGASGSNRANLRSALLNNTDLPDALAPFGGLDIPTSSNAYGVSASFQVNPKFVINGFGGYVNTRTLATRGVLPRGELDIWTYAIGLAFPDLLKDGNLGGIIVGVEPRVKGVSRGLRSAIGRDPDTSIHVEAFYQYRINDYISITPGIIWLTAPDMNSNNSDVVIGTIRTTFTF
ncbi:'Carbohydrate-selective porin, OprB family',S-layer domain containing protein [Leptolyngbyaceae cyanobacterium JSC-12]|nr:'Carbohydrate-selective porin, OprB family',S-layer domain containing protein [Leptolyngbyaceae cyanobacterium JSC-12]